MKPAFLILALFITAPNLVLAQAHCMPAAEMEAGLKDWYGELPVEGAEVEAKQMWASAETGTWTLVSYLADGNACTIAQGGNWTDDRAEDLLVAALNG